MTTCSLTNLEVATGARSGNVSDVDDGGRMTRFFGLACLGMLPGDFGRHRGKNAFWRVPAAGDEREVAALLFRAPYLGTYVNAAFGLSLEARSLAVLVSGNTGSIIPVRLK